MRKLLVFVAVLILSLSLTACGNKNDGNENLGDGKMVITINSTEFTATLYDNEAAEALIAMLPMTVNMNDMAHEKYYNLPSNLPTSATSPGMIREGDIMLWGSNCLVLFYESFSTSYSYTKIGYIENTAGLANAVCSGNATVTFIAA